MSATTNHTHQITLSEPVVRELIIKDLKEWGFDRTKNEEHRTFWDEAVKEAIARLQQDSGPISTDQSFTHDEELPKGNAAAIRRVLRNELESAKDFTFMEANDSLGFNFKPFYQWQDRRTGMTTLRKTPVAEHYTDNELDPLKRFNVIEYSAKDWFRKIWKQPECLGGYIFEALVARYMIDHVQCKSCECSGYFHWNGGITESGSWADVVCRNCMASYEIKSIKSDEVFEKKLKYNSLNGGSFRKFYKNPARYQERYLVIVRREESYISTQRDFGHRVSIGKIQKVKPRIMPESFDMTKTFKIRMKSNVEVDESSLEKSWFYVEPFHDQIAIAQEVFDDFYGDGSW